MKRFLLACAGALALAGCGEGDQSVAARWGETLAQYNFVPLYPMREDVFVGDVRMIVRNNNAYERKSRLLWRVPLSVADGGQQQFAPTDEKFAVPEANAPGFVRVAQPSVAAGAFDPSKRLRQAVLPKISSFKFRAVDLQDLGRVRGFFDALSFNASGTDSVLVSFLGVGTTEVSDLDAVPAFRASLNSRMAMPDVRHAVCVAAKTLDDEDFDNIEIAMVTRVLYARGLEYNVGDTFTAALAASVEGPSAETSGTAGAKAENSTSQSLKEVFERPLAFAVEALTVKPTRLPGFDQKECDAYASVFEPVADTLSLIEGR